MNKINYDRRYTGEPCCYNGCGPFCLAADHLSHISRSQTTREKASHCFWAFLESIPCLNYFVACVDRRLNNRRERESIEQLPFYQGDISFFGPELPSDRPGSCRIDDQLSIVLKIGATPENCFDLKNDGSFPHFKEIVIFKPNGELDIYSKYESALVWCGFDYKNQNQVDRLRKVLQHYGVIHRFLHLHQEDSVFSPQLKKILQELPLEGARVPHQREQEGYVPLDQ